METLTADDLRGVLHGRPLALSLLDEVTSFYGKTMQFVLVVGRRNGSIEPIIDHGRLGAMRLTIAAATGREVACVCHELLHAALLARGFPVISGLVVGGSLGDEFGSDLAGCCDAAFNDPQHVVMVDEFLRVSGQPRRKFIRGMVPPLDCDEIASHAASLTPESTAWQVYKGRWAIQYFTLKLTAMYMQDVTPALVADELRRRGEAIFPDFDALPGRLEHCLATGRLTDPDGFAPAVDAMWEAAWLPGRLRWVRLVRRSDHVAAIKL